MVEPVGLQSRLKGAADLEDGDGGERVEAEEHAHRVVVQVVARVIVAVGEKAVDGHTGDGGVGVANVNRGGGDGGVMVD